MARRGGGGSDALSVLLLTGLAALTLIYLRTGRAQTNSPLLPDSIEDRIDRVVAALNGAFGPAWVNFGLNALQAQIERTMPGVAVLVGAVYRVEQAYGRAPRAGAIKKQAALRLVRG